MMFKPAREALHEAFDAAGQPADEAWDILLRKYLLPARNDRQIASSAPTAEFLAAIIVVMHRARSTGTTGQPALKMLDGVMPLGRRGAKFKPAGASAGPLKQLLRRLLPRIERDQKLSAADVFDACAMKPKRGWEFVYDRNRPAQVWIPQHGATSFARFGQVLSEVRKELKEVSVPDTGAVRAS